MARLSPERPTTYLPLDVATAPGAKAGVDPTLIGIFDEALRQQWRSSSETSTPAETRPSTANDREDYERSESVNEAPASEDTGRAEAETEPTSRDAEPADADDDSTSSDEANGEEATGVEAAASAVAEEPETRSGEGESTEKAVSPGDLAEAGKKATMEGTTDTVPQEVVAVEVDGETTLDAAASAGEVIDESGEEAESAAQQKTSGRDETKTGKNAEGPHTISTNDPTSSGGDETASQQDRQSPTPEEMTEKRPRRERGHAATAPATGEPRPDAAKAGESTHTQAAPTGEQVQQTAAANAPLPKVAADLPATDAGTQSTATADTILATEPKVTASQRQAAVGQAAAKGSEQGVDPAKFVQRVTNAFSAMGQRNGPVRLKLYPPELGSLRMEITVKNGVLSARVEAETGTAKSLLMDNLPLLRERLAEQGIKVERFDVGVSDHSQGGPSERPNDGGRSSRHDHRKNDSQTHTNDNNADQTETTRPQQPAADGRLDIFI